MFQAHTHTLAIWAFNTTLLNYNKRFFSFSALSLLYTFKYKLFFSNYFLIIQLGRAVCVCAEAGERERESIIHLLDE